MKSGKGFRMGSLLLSILLGMQFPLSAAADAARGQPGDASLVHMMLAKQQHTLKANRTFINDYISGRIAVYDQMENSIHEWELLAGQLNEKSRVLLDPVDEFVPKVKSYLVNARAFAAGLRSGLSYICEDQPGKSNQARMAVELYGLTQRAELMNRLDYSVAEMFTALHAMQQVMLMDMPETDAVDDWLTLNRQTVSAAEQWAADQPGWDRFWDNVITAVNTGGRPVDFDRELKLLNGTLKLSEDALAALRLKSDATSKAHVKALELYHSMMLGRGETLADIAAPGLTDIPRDSFLRPARAECGDTAWHALSAEYNEVAAGLAEGLDSRRQAALAAASQVPELLLSVQHIYRQMDGQGAFPSRSGDLKTVLADLLKSMEELSAAVASTAQRIEDAGPGDASPGVSRHLKNDRLGCELENTDDLLISFLERAAEAVVLLDMQTGESSGEDARAAFEKLHTAMQAVTECRIAEQRALKQYYTLSLRVLRLYNEQLQIFDVRFDDIMSEAVVPSPVISALHGHFKDKASEADSLLEPVLEVLKEEPGRYRPDRLTWSAASRLGGALPRLLENGSYFSGSALDDISRLSRTEDIASFNDGLRLLKLAAVLKYPVRMLVAPDGLALSISAGDNNRYVLRGIGNTQQYRLDGSQFSEIHDFTSLGHYVGWDIRGGLKNWCNEVGQTAADFGGAVSDAAVYGWGNVHEFGVQAADFSREKVLPGAIEVGSLTSDFLTDLGNSFLEEPWKVVTYAGYGAAIVASGPFALFVAGAVAVAVTADIGESVVDVAEDRRWIAEGGADTARFALNITETIAGAAAWGAVFPAKGAKLALKSIYLATAFSDITLEYMYEMQWFEASAYHSSSEFIDYVKLLSGISLLSGNAVTHPESGDSVLELIKDMKKLKKVFQPLEDLSGDAGSPEIYPDYSAALDNIRDSENPGRELLYELSDYEPESGALDFKDIDVQLPPPVADWYQKIGEGVNDTVEEMQSYGRKSDLDIMAE